MKLIISGATGRMGAILCEKARNGQNGAELTAAVGLGGHEMFAEIGYDAIGEYAGPADCVIDFSNHAVTKDVLDYCVAHSLPVVVATTGHTEDERAQIFEAAKRIPVFFSANMSVGVAVVADLARRAAAMFPDADIEIIETHHNRKLDVPSGTALMLANAIKDVRTDAVYNIGRHENGKRDPKEIGIHSIRMGNETGTHEILISTDNETITIKHEAQNRALFADGAFTAAAFLCGKDAGLYTMRDIMGR